MTLEIETAREGADTVVRPYGELDVRTVPALRLALDEAVAGGGANLVVDLAAVSFIDSSGLGALLGRFRRMPAGRRMVLRAPQAHVRALLSLAGVPSLMQVEDGPVGTVGHGG
jgi:anti-anti-sigma factor